MKYMKKVILSLIVLLCVFGEQTSKTGVKKMEMKKNSLKKTTIRKMEVKVNKSALTIKSKEKDGNRMNIKNRIKIKQKQKQKQRLKQKLKQKQKSKVGHRKSQLHEKSKKSQNLLQKSQNQLQSTNKIQTEQNDNPILSKAQSGLYPFYPDIYESSKQGVAQIVVIQDIEGNSLLNRHDLDFTDSCNLKQGYLGLVLESSVEKYKDISNIMKTKQVIRMRPAFTVLNNNTLSTFENENVKSLIKSVSIRNRVLTVNHKMGWKGSYCFDVKYGPKYQEKESEQEIIRDDGKQTMSDDALITMCADSESNMEGWMEAIQSFHLCEVRQITVGETNIQDFTRTIKDEDEQYDEDKTNADDEQILEISNGLGVVEDSVRQNIKMINEYKKEEDKKKKVELDVVDELQDRNNCLQEQLIEEAKKSEEQLEFNLDKQITDQIKNITKPDTMKEAYKDRLYRLLQHKQNQIKETKKMENDLRAQMMAKTAQFESNKDSKLCITQPIDQKSIKTACELMYRDMGYNLVIKDVVDCLNPDTFCLACCSHFIGQAKLERRKQCVDECRGAKQATAKQTELNLKVQTDNALTPNEFQYEMPKS